MKDKARTMSTFATSTVESPQPPAHQCAVNVSVDLSSVKQLVLSRVKPPWIRVVKQLAPWLLTSAERQTVTFVSADHQSSFLDDHVQCRFFLNIDIDVIRYQNIRSINQFCEQVLVTLMKSTENLFIYDTITKGDLFVIEYRKAIIDVYVICY